MTDITATEASAGAHMRITLANCGGQFWLVEGEDHLDGLLLGQLPPEVIVEVVTFETRAELFALWEERSGNPDENSQPWALNPRLMTGVLGRLGLSHGVVQFTPWSAAMDQSAEAAIGAAAAWLRANDGGRLLLRQFLVTPAAPGYADLQRLRAQLVRAALERAGASADVVDDEAVLPDDPAHAEQLHIVTVPPAS